mmetsp:Transcript_10864/g.16052  ORF Transcript_10864/g.16052 Transcript_10864/m.16052 type:complete len:213 (+) Transcript_10864:100-738(+)
MASTCARRLMKELEEYKVSESLEHASAAPLESDIRQWHMNVRASCGPYEGTIFHLKALFPSDYPPSPPKIEVCTYIPHPNVMSTNGRYEICLGMLQNSVGNSNHHNTQHGNIMARAYEGWSSAFSAFSILMQLQSLVHGEDNFSSPEDVQVAIQQASIFRCDECGHSQEQPFPSLHKDRSSQYSSSSFEAPQAEDFTLTKWAPNQTTETTAI